MESKNAPLDLSRREVVPANNITVGFLEGTLCIVAQTNDFDVVLALPGTLAAELGRELQNPSAVN